MNARASVTVIQLGARLHYAVPQILAQAGLLKELITDIHGDHPFAAVLDRLVPENWKPVELRRLLGRRLPPGLGNSNVSTHPITSLAARLASAAGFARISQQTLTKTVLATLERRGLGPGDVVYTNLINDDLEVMQRLREGGAAIVHECIISPDSGLWQIDEAELFPDIEPAPSSTEVTIGRNRDRRKYSIADLIVVPSDFVADGVLQLGAQRERIVVVPYGLGPRAAKDRAPNPVPGRVLTVGSVGLRKGHHYLAAAARELRKGGGGFDFRVVGPVSDKSRMHCAYSGLSFVGQIPRSEVANEFRLADVFVLPTLCEGMALAHLEALAHGVPVITTDNCGSVVRDGIDGYVVPIRDPLAIAERIEWIVSDRELRGWMSGNARKRAEDFSIERYGERLLRALAPLTNEQSGGGHRVRL